MGREIDKYYIEGMDLLENKYAIANKTLTTKQLEPLKYCTTTSL